MDTMAPADGETVEVRAGVHLTPLVVGERMSVQHFHLEPDAAVPEHSHDHEQVGYVTRGTVAVVVDGTRHVVSPGESYVVSGQTPHAVENVADVPAGGIDIFSPPRPGPNELA